MRKIFPKLKGRLQTALKSTNQKIYLSKLKEIYGIRKALSDARYSLNSPAQRDIALILRNLEAKFEQIIKHGGIL